MPDFTLTPLPCWAPGCAETFAVFTDLSAHHLAVHERDLHGAPVAEWLAGEVVQIVPAADGPEAAPAAEPPPNDCALCQHRYAMLPYCSRCGPACPDCAAERQRRDTWEQTAPRCRRCGAAVPESPDHLRLRLCTVHAVLGLLAFCQTCGENHPEHGPGGRGCATWIHAPDAPYPGLEDAAAPAPCFCGHAAASHSPTYRRQPCQVPGCPCSAFARAAATYSAVETFAARCGALGLPADLLAARQLLTALGVPPEAPGAEWEAGIQEAVQRYRDRQGGQP